MVSSTISFIKLNFNNLFNRKEFNIFFVIIFIFLVLFYPINPVISKTIELDLTSAQNAVGKRFANKFCEAKKEGFSSDSSSEFALNNTYLKFVAFPDDDEFIEDLWIFTIRQIRKECGEYLNDFDENNLRDFFKEEEEIARNRDLYLPY